jgi:hypothetical protein
MSRCGQVIHKCECLDVIFTRFMSQPRQSGIWTPERIRSTLSDKENSAILIITATFIFSFAPVLCRDARQWSAGYRERLPVRVSALRKARFRKAGSQRDQMSLVSRRALPFAGRGRERIQRGVVFNLRKKKYIYIYMCVCVCRLCVYYI